MITTQNEAQKRQPQSFAKTLVLLAFLGLFVPGSYAADQAVVNLPSSAGGADIQQALEAFATGGEVVLAAGTYEITQPIVLRHDHLTLRGNGPATILHLADKANCPVVILGAALDSPARATAHLRLADLLIDGNRAGQQVELWRLASDGSQLNNNGVDIWDVNDASVERVICCHCRSGGLVTAVTRRLTVRDFAAFDNQFDGLACYFTEDSQFADLSLHDNLAAGISLDLAFNHNTIDHALLTGNDLGVFMRYSDNNSFQEVTINKSRNYGVFMAQTEAPTNNGWKPCPGTECVGNNFENLAVSDCGKRAFMINDEACTNNVLRAPRFVHNVGDELKAGARTAAIQTLPAP